MPIWNLRSIEDEPGLAICSWRILEAIYLGTSRPATRHFIGSRVGLKSARVSTAIQFFDMARLIGVTESGRTYRLQGRPEVNLDAEYVWRAWVSLNGVCAWKDVTRLVVAFDWEPDIDFARKTNALK